MSRKGVRVKEVLTYSEPNTKSQSVKCLIFILDSCRMEQHLMKQAQGGGNGPFRGGCLTNQHLGFQVSSLHKNTCLFRSNDVHEQLQRHEGVVCNKNTARPSLTYKGTFSTTFLSAQTNGNDGSQKENATSFWAESGSIS